MNQYILTLPKPISANRCWQIIKIGKRMMNVPTKEAKQYKKDVAAIALQAGIRKPLDGRVQIDMKIFPDRPLDWAKRMAKDPLNWADTVRAFDIDNTMKATFDAMKDILFNDDKFVWALTAQKMEPDEHGARIIVKITKLQQDNP